MMCSIRFPRLAFLTEPRLTGRLDCEGGSISVRGFVCRQRGIPRGAIRAQSGARVGENGRGVCPVEEQVEQNAEDGGGRTYKYQERSDHWYIRTERRGHTPPSFDTSPESHAPLYPYGPCRQAVNKCKREVGGN